MEFKYILGNRIKEIRDNLNLNQEDFCNKLNINITRASLSKIESGKQMPSAEFIKSIIESYDVSANWLLDINIDRVDDNTILNKYNSLNIKDKNVIDNMIGLLLNNYETNLSTWESTEDVENENKKSS